MMKHWISGVALTLVAIAAAGCAGVESPEGEGDEAGYVTSTAVEVDAQGNARIVAVERVPAAEMQRQIDARMAETAAASAAGTAPGPEHVGSAAEALVTDSFCDRSSLWIFDQFWSGNANSGHRLCIKGTYAGGDDGGDFGSLCRAYLPSVGHPPHCVGTWANNVRGFWPGVDPGQFSGHNDCLEPFESWPAQGPTNAGVCATESGLVHFGPIIP